jgi:hypothetical protein
MVKLGYPLADETMVGGIRLQTFDRGRIVETGRDSGCFRVEARASDLDPARPRSPPTSRPARTLTSMILGSHEHFGRARDLPSGPGLRWTVRR